MTGLKDIINFLLPIPPIILMRQDEFPNCPKIFEHISKNPPRPLVLGRIFSRLCSLVGFAWLIWFLNILAFVSVIIIILYHWGKNLNFSEPSFGYNLTCQMVISMLATLLFVGKIVFIIITTISLQLSDRCREHITNSSTTLTNKKGKK